MGPVDDARTARSARATVLAAASAFVPITLVAWASWQMIEGERSTLLRSQLPQWLWLTGGAAVLTCLAAGAFWRTAKARVAVLLGVCLAALAIFAGLLTDAATSGGFA